MAGSESTIGALLDETGGSIKTGPFGTKLKASEYTATGVPVISVGEVGFGRLRVHHDTPRVDETVLHRMPEFLLKAGDIVFGRKGAVERSAQVQPDEDGYFLGSEQAHYARTLTPALSQGERGSISEVLLVWRLRKATWRQNLAIPGEARAEAMRKVLRAAATALGRRTGPFPACCAMEMLSAWLIQ